MVRLAEFQAVEWYLVDVAISYGYVQGFIYR